MSSPSSNPRFTEKQGQYLAFIYMYTLVNGQPPAEADMQRFFEVTPRAYTAWSPSLNPAD